MPTPSSIVGSGAGEQLRELWQRWAAGDRKGAAASVPDEVADALVLHGDPASCRRQVQAYVDAGVQTPVLAVVPTPELADAATLAATLAGLGGNSLMRIADSVIVVTGAGSGIGAELARRFVEQDARHVVLADRNADAVAAVARRAGRAGQRGRASTSPTRPRSRTWWPAPSPRTARIDLFCSNAGVALGVGLDGDDEPWQRAWEIHVMAHVYAARAVLPGMLARGHGYLLNTASAAGLLSAPGRCAVLGDQACGGGAGRMAGLPVPGPRHPGQRALPDGGGHPAADGWSARRACRRQGGRGVGLT